MTRQDVIKLLSEGQFFRSADSPDRVYRVREAQDMNAAIYKVDVFALHTREDGTYTLNTITDLIGDRIFMKNELMEAIENREYGFAIGMGFHTKEELDNSVAIHDNMTFTQIADGIRKAIEHLDECPDPYHIQNISEALLISIEMVINKAKNKALTLAKDRARDIVFKGRQN